MVHPVQKHLEMHATLRLNKRMKLVDDDGPDLAEVRRKILFLEEDLEGFGGNHEEMGGFSILPVAVALCHVAMPFHHGQRCRYTESPEPVFLVIDQCFQGRNVETGYSRPPVF